MTSVSLFLLLTCVVLTHTEKLQFCNRKTPDFQKCAASAATNVIRQLKAPFPELGLPSIEPFYLTKSDAEMGHFLTKVDEQLQYIEMYGMSTATFSDFNLNYDTKTLRMAFIMKQIKLIGKYNLVGNILGENFDFEAFLTYIFRNPTYDMTVKFVEIEKNGEKFFKVANHTLFWALDDRELIVESDDLEQKQRFEVLVKKHSKAMFEDNEDNLRNLGSNILAYLMDCAFSKIPISKVFGI